MGVGTVDQGMGLPKDKLYATVYLNDDDAEKLWFKISGLPPERVSRFGDKRKFLGDG